MNMKKKINLQFIFAPTSYYYTTEQEKEKRIGIIYILQTCIHAVWFVLYGLSANYCYLYVFSNIILYNMAKSYIFKSYNGVVGCFCMYNNITDGVTSIS